MTYEYTCWFAKVFVGNNTYMKKCTAYVNNDELIFSEENGIIYLSVRFKNRTTKQFEIENICHDLGTDEGRFQYSLVQKNNLPIGLLDDFVNTCLYYCENEVDWYTEFDHKWVEEKDED